MKNLILFIGVLFCGHFGYSQVFSNNDLSITQLEKGMWVVETSDNATMYLIEGDNKAMLIDVGTKCQDLDKVIKRITDKPLEVVLTHFHPDHAGNIAYFDTVYMHEGDTALIRMLKIPYTGEIEYVSDGDEIDLGNRKIEILHAPGHTPGSIVLLDTKTSSCFTGDAFGSGQVWLQLEPYSSIDTYIRSCKIMQAKMSSEGITKIYCGHYPYVKTAFDKKYLADMQNLAEGLKNGTAPEARPYEVKVSIGSQNPMIATLGQASIVFDPEHLK